jgi:hypothetical protein
VEITILCGSQTGTLVSRNLAFQLLSCKILLCTRIHSTATRGCVDDSSAQNQRLKQMKLSHCGRRESISIRSSFGDPVCGCHGRIGRMSSYSNYTRAEYLRQIAQQRAFDPAQLLTLSCGDRNSQPTRCDLTSMDSCVAPSCLKSSGRECSGTDRGRRLRVQGTVLSWGSECFGALRSRR